MRRTRSITVGGRSWFAEIGDGGARMELWRDGEVVAKGEWDGDGFVAEGGGAGAGGDGVAEGVAEMLMATLDGWRPTHRIVVAKPRACEVVVCLDEELAYTAGEWLEGTWPQWACDEGKWVWNPRTDGREELGRPAECPEEFRVEVVEGEGGGAGG